MEVLLDFEFKLDKKQVIDTLKSYCEILTDEEIGALYDLLLPNLYECVQPTGIFTIEEKEKVFNFPIIKNYKYIVYCIVTMSDKCNEKVNEYFSYGNIKEAMVLDAMATSYLFEISSQLFKHIYIKTKKLSLGLSCRIAPGDGDVPLQYQKYILDKLDAENFLGITVTEDYMLSSTRSMAYIYGADEHIIPNRKDHDCSKCPNRKICNMRKK